MSIRIIYIPYNGPLRNSNRFIYKEFLDDTEEYAAVYLVCDETQKVLYSFLQDSNYKAGQYIKYLDLYLRSNKGISKVMNTADAIAKYPDIITV